LNKLKFTNKKELAKITSISRYFGGTPKVPKHLKLNRSKRHLREGC